MSSLSFILQWLLSSSLLVGSYLLGRRSQHDTRLLPAAIILFLFAIPIPIIASLFPGPDQLRELTSIKYGPPIAAFVEAGEDSFTESPFKHPDNVSNRETELQNSSNPELRELGTLESERQSPKPGFEDDSTLGFESQPERLNQSSALENVTKSGGQVVGAEPIERNASQLTAESEGSLIERKSGVGGQLAKNESASANITVMGVVGSKALRDASLQINSGQVVNETQTKLPNTTTKVVRERGISLPSIHVCLERLAAGTWRNQTLQDSEDDRSSASTETKEGMTRSLDGSLSMVWDWEPLDVQLCNFTRWGRQESLKLLVGLRGPPSPAERNTTDRTPPKLPEGKAGAETREAKLRDGSVTQIVVAGDSQGRLFALALLRLLRGIGEHEMGAFQKKHQDWNATAAEGKLRFDFWWAPFASNVTERLKSGGAARDSPDVLVLSFGLWHMLYTNDPQDYARGLRNLSATLQETYRITGRKGPLTFWLNSPFLVTERLNTEAKRTRLTEKMLEAYNKAASGSGVLAPDRAGILLDLFNVTKSCGELCAPDGMHYIPEAYAVLVQSMINAVALILS